MSATQGWLEAIVGDPEMGKSVWLTSTELPRLVAEDPARAVIYHSPNADDSVRGFRRQTPEEVRRSGVVPRALHLVGCRGLDAVRFATDLTERVRLPIRVVLALDEAHNVAPNYGQTWQEEYTPEERQWLRAWLLNLLRQGRHRPLACIFVSPSIAGLHPEVWRFARRTIYFRQHERPDLMAIETRFGPLAALQVSRLRPFQFISASKAAPPPGWTGYAGQLERKVAR